MHRRPAESATDGVLVRLRPMAVADVPHVAAIEMLSSPWPWDENLFASCFRPEYDCLVAERRSMVVGFAISSSAAGEGHLLNLAVHPGHRGDGIGRRLLGTVLGRFRRGGVASVVLEVRASNHVAMGLYKAYGFVEIGIRREYYRLHDGHEHAVVMQLEFDQGL